MAMDVAPAAGGGGALPAAAAPSEPVVIQVDEKLVVRLNKDGGMENMEIQGTMSLQVHPFVSSVAAVLRLIKEIVLWQNYNNCCLKNMEIQGTMSLQVCIIFSISTAAAAPGASGCSGTGPTFSRACHAQMRSRPVL